MKRRYAIIGGGLFDHTNAVAGAQQLKVLASSGFDTLVLLSLSVRDDATIYYNETPAVADGRMHDLLHGRFPEHIATLKKTGAIAQVFFGIGGGETHDFDVLANLLSTSTGRNMLISNFSVLVSCVGVDGFHLAPVSLQTALQKNTLIELTLLLNHNFGMGITYGLQGDVNDWGDCLAGIYRGNDNLQVAEAGFLVCPDNPAVLTHWQNGLAAYALPLGIADVADFIVPGCAAGNLTTDVFRQWRNLFPRNSSGFIQDAAGSLVLDRPSDLADYFMILRS